MAQPQRQAEFFASAIGVVIPKAPPLSSAQRKAIYERDGGVCKSCGVAVKFGGRTVSPFGSGLRAGAVDHVFPRSRGGQNDDSNLRLLCMSCNSIKGAQ